jgi:hypothetical protein
MYLVYKNKFGISPVIGVSLLLFVSVVAVLNFQVWFSNFSNHLFNDFELQTKNSLINLKTVGIIGENLYLSNMGENSFSLISIKINGVDCGLFNKSLSSGLEAVNVSSCIDNTSFTQDVLIITDTGLIERTMFLEVTNPVSISFNTPTFGSLSGYSYSENLGYISFNGSNYGVSLNESNFNGFAYGENLGYISFNGSNYGVSLNESSNLLYGFAYSENLGFISFSGINYNVSFNGSSFEGYAYSESAGFIHFNPSGIYGIVSYS